MVVLVKLALLLELAKLAKLVLMAAVAVLLVVVLLPGGTHGAVLGILTFRAQASLLTAQSPPLASTSWSYRPGSQTALSQRPRGCSPTTRRGARHAPPSRHDSS